MTLVKNTFLTRSRSLASSPNKEAYTFYKEIIKKFKEKSNDYSVVDYPAYNNVGDSAIWVGQDAVLFDVFQKKPSYVASQNDYKRDIDEFSKNYVVFISGGGNFGDLWPHHQDFRTEILERYPDRKIVQLPQSIYFSDPRQLDRAKRAIGAHRDFHLLVRDRASLNLALQEFDCPVALCPDAAHCIRTYVSAPAKHEVFSLVRTDMESSVPGLQRTLSKYGPAQDWEGINEYFFKNESLPKRIFRRHIQYKLPSSLMMAYRSRMYNYRAGAAVEGGTKLLSKGRIVVSDRLHAHILCVLMGKAHVSFDNANGKIGEYIRQWGGFGVTEMAVSPAEIDEKINMLLERISKTSSLGIL